MKLRNIFAGAMCGFFVAGHAMALDAQNDPEVIRLQQGRQYLEDCLAAETAAYDQRLELKRDQIRALAEKIVAETHTPIIKQEGAKIGLTAEETRALPNVDAQALAEVLAKGVKTDASGAERDSYVNRTCGLAAYKQGLPLSTMGLTWERLGKQYGHDAINKVKFDPIPYVPAQELQPGS